MRNILSFLFICLSVAMSAQNTVKDASSAPDRWTFDFVVPDSGNFAKAINAANTRTDKKRRFRIFIKSNYYIIPADSDSITIMEGNRKVSFPNPITTLNAPNTSIIGENWKDTKVLNIPMHEGIDITATLFLNNADSTYIQDVELWCNYKNDPKAFANRAVALKEKDCKGNIFKNISLLSTQDTYYTNTGGSTYLEDCRLQGTVDFICGGGTIFMNGCDLVLRSRQKNNGRDVICAPSTSDRLFYGYIFNNCRITGAQEQNGRFYLARPWRNSPRAVFINTIMHILPDEAGYGEMSSHNFPKLFAEYNSHMTDGTRVDMTKRKQSYKNKKGEYDKISFNTELTEEEAQKYSLEKVFPKWKPQDACKQISAPVIKMKGRRTIIWKDIPEAYCYAICIDGDVRTFTTSPYYEVPEDTEEGASFSIRCANWYGGLGKASNEVVYPNR